jgi:hypothetical protein
VELEASQGSTLFVSVGGDSGKESESETEGSQSEELEHDEAWINTEIANFRQIANGFLLSEFQ